MSMPMSIPPKKSMSMGVSILLLMSGLWLARSQVYSPVQFQHGDIVFECLGVVILVGFHLYQLIR